MAKSFKNLSGLLVGLVLLAGVAVVVWQFISPSEDTAIVKVNVPKFSPRAQKGSQAFAANCAQCHGQHGTGGEKGPPLVHDIYNPGHHGDRSFYLAATRGVPQHHWRFGSMPPQPQVQRHEMTRIIQYVRELQEANGIFYREHRM